MNEDIAPPSGEAAQPESSRALVVRTEAALVAESIAPTPAGLPARIAQRLPELWDNGRGPLARAVVAGGLLALGSVVGRLATGTAGALVPVGRGGATLPVPGRPGRVEVTIDTEIGARVARPFGRATTHWTRQRVRIVQEWPER